MTQKQLAAAFAKAANDPKFLKALEEAEKPTIKKAGAAKGVPALCAKYAVIEPKLQAINMLFTLLFPKSKLDLKSFIDGVTAFCSIQK